MNRKDREHMIATRKKTMELKARAAKAGNKELSVPRKQVMSQRKSFTREQLMYWNSLLDIVELKMNRYLDSERVKDYLANYGKKPNGQGYNPPSLTPKELVDEGIAYFRFTINQQRNVAIYGLAVFLGVDVTILTRMEQAGHVVDAYKNDIYRPIIRQFKALVGFFHEDMGSDKLNPNFHIYMLKVMKSGFEESVDLNVNNVPQGLSEQEREDIRSKVKTFTEDFTKHKIATREV